MDARWTRLSVHLPAVGLLVLLAAQLATDPAPGVTFSNSPFTDEAWNVMGARNVVLLGDWSAGNWALHLVQLPFTVLTAAAFELLGVGIVQARLVPTLSTVAAVGLLSVMVGRRLGRGAGALAGVALAASSLVLYYGRLAYMENLVLLGLVGGLAAVTWRGGLPSRGAALGAGVLLAVAVGTKPSALFPALGILLGLGLAMRRREWSGRILQAAGSLAAMGLAWVILIGLPHAQQIGWVLEIWAQQTLPSDLGDAIDRIAALPTGDSVGALVLPLAVGGVLGAVSAAVRWRSLDQGQRALAGAALGWLVVGLGVLLLASYRPNRYALPILPALAILTAYAVPAGEAMLRRLPGLALRVALATLAVAGLVAPGIADYGRWAAIATSQGPRMQERVMEAVDDRPIEGGLAPFFAMRVAAPIYVRWSTSRVNSGDLYAEEGVRWMIRTGTYEPVWADSHADAWEARQELMCFEWGRGRHCLIRLP